MRSPKKKIASILKHLSEGLYEKEDVLRLCLLASVAGENVFLLGPPGTAKSLVCRRLKYAFEKARSFEYLLNQFSTPDEVFGPLSIRRLKDDGVYERLTEGFLPVAEIVFLDEIWKAGSAILNSLLTAINEKVFKNGALSQAIPLKLLVSASNELPPKEAGFEALWDRFLIRIPVGGITGIKAFRKMLDAPEAALGENVFVRNRISAAEFERWQNAADSARLGVYAFNFMARLKRAIQKYNISKTDRDKKIYISDRRWRKMARLMKASAVLNGRRSVDLEDCFLLEKCLWNSREQIRKTEELVRKTMLEEGIIAVKRRRVIHNEAAALKKTMVRTLTTYKDTRKTVLCRKSGYYSFCDPHTGHIRFLKQADYDASGAEEKTLTLYKQMPVKTGYLNQNRPALFKNGYDAFTSCGIDLEYIWKPDKSVLFVKNVKTDVYPVVVDGKPACMETVTNGHAYRITRAPEEQERARWDKKTTAFFEAAGALEKKLDIYIHKYIKKAHTHFFVDSERVCIITDHIINTKKNLEKLKLEILEIQNYYQNIKNETTIIGLD